MNYHHETVQHFKLETGKYKTIDMFRSLYLKTLSIGLFGFNCEKNFVHNYEKFKYLFFLQHLQNI